MATVAPAAHPLSIDGSVMTEDDWNAEAADMIEEVLKTQQEVSQLLTTHTTATFELQALKDSCEKEVSTRSCIPSSCKPLSTSHQSAYAACQEVSVPALFLVCRARVLVCCFLVWPCYLHYTRRACMRQCGTWCWHSRCPPCNNCNVQLQELQADAWKLQLYTELERMSRQLEQLAPLAQDACVCDSHEDSSEPVASVDKAAGPAEATNAEPNSNEEDELCAIDDEIAALDKQLTEAKKEMQNMMRMKLNLEKELQLQEVEPAEA